MAICSQCGSSMEEGAVFCPVCGAEQEAQNAPQVQGAQAPAYVVRAAPAVQKTNSLAIAGFVCSVMGFFCCGIPALVGLILSIVGYSQIKSRNEGGKGLAVAGIIIGAVLPVLMIVFYVLYFTFFAMIA